jgi:hypothetical protein
LQVKILEHSTYVDDIPMPDEAKFTEGGVRMLGSVAGAMAVVMPATGPVGMAIGAMIGKALRALPDGQGSFQSSSHISDRQLSLTQVRRAPR